MISDWQSWTSVMLPKLFDIPHRSPVPNYMLLVFSSTKSKRLMIKVGKISFYKASVFEKRQSREQYLFCEISPLVRHKAEAPVRVLRGGCPSVLKPHSLTELSMTNVVQVHYYKGNTHTHTCPKCIAGLHWTVQSIGDGSWRSN